MSENSTKNQEQKTNYMPSSALSLLVFLPFLIFFAWNFIWIVIYLPFCSIGLLPYSGYGCLVWRIDLPFTLIIQIILGLSLHLFFLLKLKKSHKVVIIYNIIYLIIPIMIYYFSGIFSYSSAFSRFITDIITFIWILTGFIDIYLYATLMNKKPKNWYILFGLVCIFLVFVFIILSAIA